MAKSTTTRASRSSKRRRDEDDDDEPVTKRKKAKDADEDDDDEDSDDDEEEDTEEEDDEEEAEGDEDDDDDSDSDADAEDDDEESDADDEDDDEDEDADDDSDSDDSSGVSLDLDDAEAGGGLPSDIDVTFKNWRARVALFSDYNEDGELANTAGEDPDAAVVVSVDCHPEEGDPFSLHLTVGKKLVPSKDGVKASRTGTRLAKRKGVEQGGRGMGMTSNVFYFMKSMYDAGLPAARRWPKPNDYRSLEGLKAHLIRQPAPERAGLSKRVKDDDDDTPKFEKTIPAVSAIHFIPWKGKKGSTTTTEKPAKKAKAKSAKDEAPAPATKKKGGVSKVDESDVKDFKRAVVKVLAAAEGPISKEDLYEQVYAIVKKAANRNQILGLCNDEKALASGPWTFNSRKGTLSPAK